MWSSRFVVCVLYKLQAQQGIFHWINTRRTLYTCRGYDMCISDPAQQSIDMIEWAASEGRRLHLMSTRAWAVRGSMVVRRGGWKGRASFAIWWQLVHRLVTWYFGYRYMIIKLYEKFITYCYLFLMYNVYSQYRHFRSILIHISHTKTQGLCCCQI